MTKHRILELADLEDRTPAYALASEVDLAAIRYDDDVPVLYGRCLHHGALLADGHVRGNYLVVEKSASRLKNFFVASTELMQVMARACGHAHASQSIAAELTTWKCDMPDLSGVAFDGVGGAH